MKLQPDRLDTLAVTGYGPGWIGVSGEKVMHSVVITSIGDKFDWNCVDFSELSSEHFVKLAEIGRAHV